ncbi:MAG TPA: hypothetical protein VN578_18280 [Candidatus Binatia bacterium]|jgi:hypothetical protein|nr:hypothetical protein [Candidatus Binatia bacterium]
MKPNPFVLKSPPLALSHNSCAIHTKPHFATPKTGLSYRSLLRLKGLLARVAGAVACACLTAHAQVTMTDIGPTAPTPGSDDIAQTSTNGDVKFPDGLNYYLDNGANNGEYTGQTFTTGTHPAGYTLTSVSIYSSGIDDGGGYNNPQLFHLFIYSVSGGSAMLLKSYTNTSSFTDGNWIQWTNLNLEVLANAIYAYGFGRDASGSGWAGLGHATNNPYAGGELAMLPPTGGPIIFGSSHSYDAAFEIGLTTNTSQLPPRISAEPVSRTVYTNAPTTFGVGVAPSAVPPSYQWFKISGGTTNAIAGATSASLSLPHAQTSDIAGYQVVISNAYGATNSTTANLTVVASSPDAISVQLQPYGDGAESTDLPLLPTDKTGAFPATNWNPLLVNVRPADSTVPQNFPGLEDKLGIGSAVQLAVLGTSDGWTANQPAPDNAPITKLLNSFVKAGYGTNWPNFPNTLGSGLDVFVFSNLDNSQTYNVYVYLLANDDANFPNIDAGTGVTNYVGDELQNVNQASDFIPSLNQDPASAGALVNRDQGNFVHLVGIPPTAGAITISVNFDDPANNLFNPNSGSGVGVCGLQIVRSSVDTFPVTIIREPADQRAVTNIQATFTVGALGVPLPAYQWHSVIAGVTNLIANATNAAYSTPPVQDSDTGNGYFVTVSNALNQVTSATAILTAGHLVTATGFLEADEYFGNYASAIAALSTLYPTASLPAPDKIEYLRIFNDNTDLPNNGGERIHGWFTPPVTGNYVFFVASDDGGALWLSTNSSPTNVYEIAQNQQWMVCGNDGPADWNLASTGSGEYPFRSTGEWRSDGFETNGGPSAIAAAIFGSWSPWPGLNGDGSIPLTAGSPYYIEFDHYQGGGGQGAAVTYKLAGAPDPNTGAASLLADGRLSSVVPDSLAPQPRPRIVTALVSGPNITLSGTNGLVNALYSVLSSTNAALPLSNWTVLTGGRFASNGNFSVTTAKGTDKQRFYILQVP